MAGIPLVEDRTVVQSAQGADPEATVVKLDILQGTRPKDLDTTGSPASADPGASLTSGTASGTPSGSKSASWSNSEQWLVDEGQRVEVGTVIKDRFELLELVGEGGMGMVFRALDRRKSKPRIVIPIWPSKSSMSSSKGILNR